MKKSIKNTRDGFHFNSKHWQNYKKSLPPLPQNCFNIAVGMLLGDATMYHVSNEAYIKFEQGYKQKDFCFHIFDMFSRYCFMEQPGKRYEKNSETIKSYWFKTFSFPDFTKLYNLFYTQFCKTSFYRNTQNKRIKTIKKGLIANYLTPQGLAYWIMCDGSLQKNGKTHILHTQSYTLQENNQLCSELNKKFGFQSRPIGHKDIYYVIEIPPEDYELLYNHVSAYIIPSLKYKIVPSLKKK